MTEHWRHHAACRGHPTDHWYPEKGRFPTVALTICRRCPVADECLQEALARAPTYDFGVWGGARPDQRLAMRLGRIPTAPNPPQSPELERHIRMHQHPEQGAA